MKLNFCLIILAGFFAGCDISDNEATPGESFIKIYDENSFNASFIPVDIAQTADGGYLILGSTRLESSDFTGVYLMKVDENGDFISEQNLSEEYVNPVKSLMSIEGSHYFIAMTALSQQAFLFQADEAGTVSDPVELTGLTYPTSASFDGNNLLLQSYNNADKMTVVTTMNLAGQISSSQPFTIGSGEEVEAPIIQHFTRTGKQFPFSVGRLQSGLIYFNGFYDHTFSLAFTSINDENPVGVSQGQQDDSGISAVAPLTGNEFAIARFSFGDNYIQPKADINPGEISSSVNIQGNLFPELIPDAPVILKKITVNQKEILLYGSDTKGGRIILLAYSADSGELLGTKYLGFSNPYNISSFIKTEDDGLAVLANTAVAGRFDRFSLFKLSKAELEELAN